MAWGVIRYAMRAQVQRESNTVAGREYAASLIKGALVWKRVYHRGVAR